MASVDPTEEELADFSKACSRLWHLDENRFVADQDYAINLQSGKRVFSRSDAAAESLFKFVKKDKFFQSPTYKCFYALLDNYERETGVAETVTRGEKQENRAFINELMKTKPMQFAQRYLSSKGLASGDLSEFKVLLQKIWFDLYRRETRGDSSGFEHVFVGEVRDGKVTGFHNWIQFFLEERKGRVDYKGYIFPRRRNRGADDAPDSDDQLLTLQFAWEKEVKSVTSMFIGVSPEFEIALCTMCFLNGEESVDMEMGEFDITMKTHTMGRGKFLAACYPEIRQT